MEFCAGGEYFILACEALGISLPRESTAATQTVTELMPEGGLGSSHIPAACMRAAVAALEWATHLAGLSPAWSSLGMSEARFLLGVCGINDPPQSPDLWEEHLEPLRTSFPGANAPFTLPTHLRRNRGCTPKLFPPDHEQSRAVFFQLQCDAIALEIPELAHDVFSAVATSTAEWPPEKGWHMWTTPRELAACHVWAAHHSAPPAAGSADPWVCLSAASVMYLIRMHGIACGRVIHLTIAERGDIIIKLRQTPRQLRDLTRIDIPGPASARLRRDRAAEWLQANEANGDDLAEPFRDGLRVYESLSAPTDTDIIRAIADLMPANGIGPHDICPRLQSTAALALVWCVVFAKEPWPWACLPRESKNLLLALGSADMETPFLGPGLEALREEFRAACQTWEAQPLPRNLYPVLGERSRDYTMQYWIDSGALYLPGLCYQRWLHETGEPNQALPSAAALEYLRPLSALVGTPEGFIPASVAQQAAVAIKWAIRVTEHMGLRDLSERPLSFIFGVCGISPDDRTPDERLRLLEERLRHAAKELHRMAGTAPGATDGHLGPTGNPAPGAGPASGPALAIGHSDALALPYLSYWPFFETLLAMARCPRPSGPAEIRRIFERTPPLPEFTERTPGLDTVQLELSAGLTWCLQSLWDQPGPRDSLWSKPPRAALRMLVTWLSGHHPPRYLWRCTRRIGTPSRDTGPGQGRPTGSASRAQSRAQAHHALPCDAHRGRFGNDLPGALHPDLCDPGHPAPREHPGVLRAPQRHESRNDFPGPPTPVHPHPGGHGRHILARGPSGPPGSGPPGRPPGAVDPSTLGDSGPVP